MDFVRILLLIFAFAQIGNLFSIASGKDAAASEKDPAEKGSRAPESDSPPETVKFRTGTFQGATLKGERIDVSLVSAERRFSSDTDFKEVGEDLEAFLKEHPEPLPLFYFDEFEEESTGGRAPKKGVPGRAIAANFSLSDAIRNLKRVQQRLKEGSLLLVNLASEKTDPLRKALRDSRAASALENSIVPVPKGKIVQSYLNASIGTATTFAALIGLYSFSEVALPHMLLIALSDGLDKLMNTRAWDSLNRFFLYHGRYDPNHPEKKVHWSREGFSRFLYGLVRTYLFTLPYIGVPDRADPRTVDGWLWAGNFAFDGTLINMTGGRTHVRVMERYFNLNGAAEMAPFEKVLGNLANNPDDFTEVLSRLAAERFFENPYPALLTELRAGKPMVDVQRSFHERIRKRAEDDIRARGGTNFYLVQSILSGITSNLYYLDILPWHLFGAPWCEFTVGRAANITLQSLFNHLYSKHPDAALAHADLLARLGTTVTNGLTVFKDSVARLRKKKAEEATVEICENAVTRPRAADEAFQLLRSLY